MSKRVYGQWQLEKGYGCTTFENLDTNILRITDKNNSLPKYFLFYQFVYPVVFHFLKFQLYDQLNDITVSKSISWI